jgi:hypothetical protein
VVYDFGMTNSTTANADRWLMMAQSDRWIVRANTPGGHRWVVGQAWTEYGLFGLVDSVPMSDAVRVERWAGQIRLTEADTWPALPGAEHVRGLELALPQFALPAQSFTLTAPAETQPRQSSLF